MAVHKHKHRKHIYISILSTLLVYSWMSVTWAEERTRPAEEAVDRKITVINDLRDNHGNIDDHVRIGIYDLDGQIKDFGPFGWPASPSGTFPISDLSAPWQQAWIVLSRDPCTEEVEYLSPSHSCYLKVSPDTGHLLTSEILAKGIVTDTLAGDDEWNLASNSIAYLNGLE